jgi:hypothetical protein
MKMTKTLQEKYAEALIMRGEKEVKRTFKYIVFSRSTGVHNTSKFYYLGKSGSLRFGNNIASSIPVSSNFKYKLLQSLLING